GSRGHLGEARRRYPGLLPVLLHVEEAVLRERLRRRGRESAEQSEARLRRSRRMQAELASEAGLHVLDNSGSLQDCVERLLTLIRQHADRRPAFLDPGQGRTAPRGGARPLRGVVWLGSFPSSPPIPSASAGAATATVRPTPWSAATAPIAPSTPARSGATTGTPSAAGR